MSLYIALFENAHDDREIDGVEVGTLEDFNTFRTRVALEFFDGDWTAGFPSVLGVADNGPGWSVKQLASLLSELEEDPQPISPCSGNEPQSRELAGSGAKRPGVATSESARIVH